jgi:hypothetical protein
MTPDDDYSEADTTAAEFDAMWDQGEPVETVGRTATRATAGAPLERSAITSSTVAATSVSGTRPASDAWTISVVPARPGLIRASATTQ